MNLDNLPKIIKNKLQIFLFPTSKAIISSDDPLKRAEACYELSQKIEEFELVCDELYGIIEIHKQNVIFSNINNGTHLTKENNPEILFNQLSSRLSEVKQTRSTMESFTRDLHNIQNFDQNNNIATSSQQQNTDTTATTTTAATTAPNINTIPTKPDISPKQQTETESTTSSSTGATTTEVNTQNTNTNTNTTETPMEVTNNQQNNQNQLQQQQQQQGQGQQPIQPIQSELNLSTEIKSPFSGVNPSTPSALENNQSLTTPQQPSNTPSQHFQQQPTPQQQFQPSNTPSQQFQQQPTPQQQFHTPNPNDGISANYYNMDPQQQLHQQQIQQLQQLQQQLQQPIQQQDINVNNNNNFNSLESQMNSDLANYSNSPITTQPLQQQQTQPPPTSSNNNSFNNPTEVIQIDDEMKESIDVDKLMEESNNNNVNNNSNRQVIDLE